MPNVLSKASPSDETSSTTARSPASTISANSLWRSGDSGVVFNAGRAAPPTSYRIVPINPVDPPDALKTEEQSSATVVFPFVPVMPTILSRRFHGSP